MVFMPPPLLESMLKLLMRRMKRRHPRLFNNLAGLKPSVIVIELSDLPHRFVLRTGRAASVLSLLSGDEKKIVARIRGSLESLLDMLEGRSDGDTLFFNRGLSIEGDMEIVVALRNLLDREEISPMDDILSFFGPFAKPAGGMIYALDQAIRAMTGRRAS